MSKPIQKTDKPENAVVLKFGYEDKETPDTRHQTVRFGIRPTGGDFMKAADECGGFDLQFKLGLVSAAISEFGSLTMPVPLTVLLSLNQIDREQLLKAYYAFLVSTGSGDGEILDGGKVRLASGIERGGKKIFEVEFGKLLNGYDEIEIESAVVSDWQANALRITKEIVQPSDLTLAEIESLDIDDFTLLRKAEEQWLDSFRSE